MGENSVRPILRSMLGGLGLSALVTAALVLTSLGVSSRLGSPQYWPWLLTGLQVVSLWAAGAKRSWGWLLGASVQAPWIAYAVLTRQLGFIPGCVISAAVQAYSFVRHSSRNPEHERSPADVSAHGASTERPHVVRRSAGLVIRPFPAYVSDRTLRTYTLGSDLSPVLR
jgi:hypothetical protein